MRNKIEALERLAKLKTDGVLSDAEFHAQKTALLAGKDPAPSPTWRARWREGREKSRAVRRFFRWFWGLQLAAILLAGIYFLSRGQTLQDARDAQAAGKAVVATAQATSAPAVTEADIIVTDHTLADRPGWDDLDEAANPLSFCANSQARIANSSSRTLNLQLSVRESDVSWDLGVVKPGGVLRFDVGEEGGFVLSDLTDGQPITAYEVSTCHAMGNSQ